MDPIADCRLIIARAPANILLIHDLRRHHHHQQPSVRALRPSSCRMNNIFSFWFLHKHRRRGSAQCSTIIGQSMASSRDEPLASFIDGSMDPRHGPCHVHGRSHGIVHGRLLEHPSWHPPWTNPCWTPAMNDAMASSMDETMVTSMNGSTDTLHAIVNCELGGT